MTYAEFLQGKEKAHAYYGTDSPTIHERAFPFQRHVSKWAIKKGRACIFAGTGLGKTLMQCEFMRNAEGSRLIVAPLAVAAQTIAEGAGIGLEIHPVRTAADFVHGAVNIINYDRIDALEDVHVDAVVLDESSIIKNHSGAFTNYLTGRFAGCHARLACTATPAPNDYMELGTHAEFVGAMTREEMLATYFTHDGGDTSEWRLKRHAVGDFWRWVSTWAYVFNHPSDIGFEQPGYDLPPISIESHVVQVESGISGGLFGDSALTATQLGASLKESITERVAIARDLFGNLQEPAILWCNIDAEQDALEKAFPGALSVRGSQSIEVKEDRLNRFSKEGGIMITKPRIAGYGMNWQHCSKMAFVGVTYSFEQVYQSVRRCWRFGQTRPVSVHIITANTQDSVLGAIRFKEEAHHTMANEMRKYCRVEVAA